MLACRYAGWLTKNILHSRVCSHFVPDFGPKLGYIVVHPFPSRGALARRCRGGARSGPAAGFAPLCSRVADPGFTTDPLKQTARDEQLGSHSSHKASSRAAQRATLACPSGSQHPPRGHRCWFFLNSPALHPPGRGRALRPGSHAPAGRGRGQSPRGRCGRSAPAAACRIRRRSPGRGGSRAG